MALEEGVSTKSKDRGYGLRTTADLVCNGLGGDVLLSSRSGLVWKNQSNRWTDNSKNWDGTTFIARLYPPPDDFDIYRYVE